MTTESRRINLTISKEKYEFIKELAEERNLSMAELVEMFMDTGMDVLEDIALADLMEERIQEEPDRLYTIDEL